VPRAVRVVLILAGLAILIGLIGVPSARAQRAPGTVGIGGQIGEPSGLSLKIYRPSSASFDLLVAWNQDANVFVDAHGMYEYHLGESQSAHVFLGPGAFIEVQERQGEDETVAGLSGRIGLGFLVDRFEIYGHVTPQLALTPATEGDVGGGIGLRIYL
jgi:hypothetical protein